VTICDNCGAKRPDSSANTEDKAKVTGMAGVASEAGAAAMTAATNIASPNLNESEAEKENPKAQQVQVGVYPADQVGYDYQQQVSDVDYYNQQGYDGNYYNQQGYDANYYNQQGYDRNYYNQQGYDGKYYNQQGYDAGYYNQQGYDANYYNQQAYNQDYGNEQNNSKKDNSQQQKAWFCTYCGVKNNPEDTECSSCKKAKRI
jgi:hypothetical protein